MLPQSRNCSQHTPPTSHRQTPLLFLQNWSLTTSVSKMMVSKATYMCSFHGLKERSCFFSTCVASLQQHCGGPGPSPAGRLLLWGQTGAGGLHGTGNKLPASVSLLWCGVRGLHGTGNKLPASVNLLWCVVWCGGPIWNKYWPVSVSLLWCRVLQGAYMEQVTASNVVRWAYIEQVTASISQPAVVWCGVMWCGARVPAGTGPVVCCGGPAWNR